MPIRWLAVFAIVSIATPAYAQASLTVGSVRGVVRDPDGPAVGATIVASSAALQGEQSAISDDNGQYFITELPPGIYALTVFYANRRWARHDVLIQLGKEAVVNLAVDPNVGAPVGG